MIPRVALDSRVLAQRHANALLLAAFLRRSGAQPLNFTAGAFFNHTASEGTAPWEGFVAWLRSEVPESPGLDQELRTLLAGTGLSVTLTLRRLLRGHWWRSPIDG